ncbi:hypothetical protein CEXT_129501 [Caerostris extrusa]|uniref:Uncharacterized protein n=1 Tax=Caerostris extrusa TaxID=172846 RepID=A0AAV4NH53_CAEEX|nr:hypothetical protein CEXT_129501 [Caerostris extrusa]
MQRRSIEERGGRKFIEELCTSSPSCTAKVAVIELEKWTACPLKNAELSAWLLCVKVMEEALVSSEKISHHMDKNSSKENVRNKPDKKTNHLTKCTALGMGKPTKPFYLPRKRKHLLVMVQKWTAVPEGGTT